MKKKLKEEMLEAIFVQTGGRPENPKIADICAEVAMNFITSNTNLTEDNKPLSKNCEHFQHEHCDCIGRYCLASNT